MKIVVHAPEPKPAKKVEPVVGGVYKFDGSYRLVVRVDTKLYGIDLSDGSVAANESLVLRNVADGQYVLVDAELHVKEGA